MGLIIYAEKSNRAAQRFGQQFDLNPADRSIETFNSMDALARRLRQPFSARSRTIALFFVADKHDLVKLHTIRDLLEDTKILLVLPDSNPQTLSAGHQLRPRYIGFAYSDLEDVAAVLQKMFSNAQDNSKKKKEVMHAK